MIDEERRALVERLRDAYIDAGPWARDLMHDAADEIERLTVRADTATREREAMREALALAEDVLSRSPYSNRMWVLEGDKTMHPAMGIQIIRDARALSPAEENTDGR